MNQRNGVLVGRVKSIKPNLAKFFFKVLTNKKTGSKEKIPDNLSLYGSYCSMVLPSCSLVGLLVGPFFICSDSGFSRISIRTSSSISNGFPTLPIGDIPPWESSLYGIV